MKKHHLAIVILASSLYLFNNVWAADLEEGFMGYKWGDEIWHYDGLKQLYNKGGITFYSNPSESYSIEGITIGDVIYGFYNEKFYAVYINIDSHDKYDVIERYMKSKYGLPDTKTTTKDTLLTYKWKYKDVSIKLKTDKLTGNMKVAFYHEPTSRGLEEERIVEVIETSDVFFPVEKNKTINMIPFLESWSDR